MVIYVAFAVFLATIFILNATFLPKMAEAGAQVSSGAAAAGITNMPATIKTDIIPQIQLIFVISVVIHAFGDGILAGVLQDGRIANGLRHSFIMAPSGSSELNWEAPEMEATKEPGRQGQGLEEEPRRRRQTVRQAGLTGRYLGFMLKIRGKPMKVMQPSEARPRETESAPSPTCRR